MVGSGLGVIDGFELGGRDAAELAVESSVVEPIDIAERGQLDVLAVSPRSLSADTIRSTGSPPRARSTVNSPSSQSSCRSHRYRLDCCPPN